MKASTKYIPFEASHPGSLILDEIKFRGINQADLAVQMSVQKSLLNEIIKGKRALTADIALLLEKILEIPAQYWMNLQSQYELDLARINEKNIKKLANVEKWSIINQYVPISYLKKQNYIQDDINDNIEKIKSIYNVDSIDQLVQKNAQQHFAFYRKSEKLIVEDKNM
jgi:HTH-type transcriptional regulator/antitoxin HigA